MPSPESPFRILKIALKKMTFFIVLWLVLMIFVAFEIAQYTQDPVWIESVALSAGLLLLVWWALVSWRQKVNLLLDLQELLLEKKILPYDFIRLNNAPPWELGSWQKKILEAASNQYRALQDKAQESDQTLEKYVGTKVSLQASKKALRAELGGEEKRVYVLFSDLRGFTPMTELLQPGETVKILNTMFTAMEEVITQGGGDINKYIGDAIFAYFRRPYGDETETAARVLRTAIRMQDRFEDLNKTIKTGYSKPVDVGLGIGIAAGTAIMGNLGSPNRMEHALIGDTINTASRLCGIAKHGQILLNEEMASVTRARFELRALDAVPLKGKSGVYTPYEVLREKININR